MKEIRAISGSIEESMQEELNAIVLKAQKDAQDTLAKFKAAKSTSQQLSPEEAVNEIGVKFNPSTNSAYVYAPINEENKNSMYFLEYGAGIHSTRGSSHMNGEAWIYPIKDGEHDIHHEITGGLAIAKRDGTAQHSLGDQAYKFRDWSYQTNQWFGVTKTSRPIKFMAKARENVIWEARPRMVKAINFAIQNHGRRVVRTEEE